MPKPPINYTPVTELSEPLVKVYEQLTDELLINIARHFNVNDKASGTLEWQYTKLAEIGKLTDESINIIAKSTGLSSALVKYTIETAALEAINKIEPDLLKAAKAGLLDTTQATVSDTVKRILTAYQQQTIDALNMVNTTMLQSTLDAYRMAVANTANFEKAITAAQKTLNVQTANVITGVSSRTEAVRKAIKQMAANGITGFVDRAGHNWSAEAYVNMDIRTTSGNVALQSVMTRNADYGNDLVWVPINATARPKCYPWQGKVISTANRSGTVEDLNGKVYDITPLNQTSYGEPDGLFGINCHHAPPNVFIAGISVIRGTVPPKEENDARYAETQNQRRLEREIRYAKRDAAMAKASGDDEVFKEAALKVKETTANYKQYSQDHNLPTYLDRTQVYEYNRSVSSSANWAARKAAQTPPASAPPATPASAVAPATTPSITIPPAATPTNPFSSYKFSDDDDYNKMLADIINNGEPTAKALFQKYVRADDSYIATSNFQGTDHHSRGQLYYNAANDKTNVRGKGTTYLHEVGHFIDWKNAYVSTDTMDLYDAILADVKAVEKAKKTEIGGKPKIADVRDAISYDLYKAGNKTNFIQDLYGGSRNKRDYGVWGRWGHSAGYWNPSALEQEAFAHFNAVSYDPEKIALAQKYLPTAYAKWLEIVKTLI